MSACFVSCSWIHGECKMWGQIPAENSSATLKTCDRRSETWSRRSHSPCWRQGVSYDEERRQHGRHHDPEEQLTQNTHSLHHECAGTPTAMEASRRASQRICCFGISSTLSRSCWAVQWSWRLHDRRRNEKREETFARMVKGGGCRLLKKAAPSGRSWVFPRKRSKCGGSIAPIHGAGRQLLLTWEMSLKADPWKGKTVLHFVRKWGPSKQLLPKRDLVARACRSAVRHLWAQGGNSNVAAVQ